MKRQWLLTFLSLLLLWVVITQLNHYLAIWHFHIFVGALFIAFSAMRLPVRGGLMITVLAGLLWDANTPVPFGSHMLLFAIAHVLIFKVRFRIPAEHSNTQVAVALVTNFGLFVALAIIAVINSPMVALMWPRMLFDILLSQILLVLIGPWFLALQSRILEIDRYALRSRF
jgi:rod shape-determining protein MreD|uniref:hypothetical protein n=1 Tax=Cephaloticoccus sp. TaxID=1985742 RepID=UPI004049F680